MATSVPNAMGIQRGPPALPLSVRQWQGREPELDQSRLIDTEVELTVRRSVSSGAITMVGCGCPGGGRNRACDRHGEMVGTLALAYRCQCLPRGYLGRHAMQAYVEVCIGHGAVARGSEERVW